MKTQLHNLKAVVPFIALCSLSVRVARSLLINLDTLLIMIVPIHFVPCFHLVSVAMGKERSIVVSCVVAFSVTK